MAELLVKLDPKMYQKYKQMESGKKVRAVKGSVRNNACGIVILETSHLSPPCWNHGDPCLIPTTGVLPINQLTDNNAQSSGTSAI